MRMDSIEFKADNLIRENKLTIRRSEKLLARMGYLELNRLEIKDRIKSAKDSLCVTALPPGSNLTMAFPTLSDGSKSQIILMNYLAVVEDMLEETSREYHRSLVRAAVEYSKL